MPGAPTELGFGYFALVKYAGYTSFCRWVIQPRLEKLRSRRMRIPSAWMAGLVRTCIGVGIGVIVGLGFWKIPLFSSHGVGATLAFFLLLIPVRVGEWWALLRLRYRELTLRSPSRIYLIGSGVMVSFALDAIGIIAALVLPGGAWVC